MMQKMNYEPNVRQLVVLHSTYIYIFFMAVQLAGRLFNTTPHSPTTKYIHILVSTIYKGPNFDNDPCKFWKAKKSVRF